MYVSGIAIHLLRISDGRDVILKIPSEGRRHLQESRPRGRARSRECRLIRLGSERARPPGPSARTARSGSATSYRRSSRTHTRSGCPPTRSRSGDPSWTIGWGKRGPPANRDPKPFLYAGQPLLEPVKLLGPPSSLPIPVWQVAEPFTEVPSSSPPPVPVIVTPPLIRY